MPAQPMSAASAGCRKLSGTFVIITGASRGFGAQIARTMWEEGATLLLVARSSDDLSRLAEGLGATAEPNQRVHFIAADLATPEGPSRVMRTAQNLWDRLDVLVNNAAVVGPIGKAWDTDWEQWNAAIRLNLLAPVELCRLSVPWMAVNGGGSIINISGGGATGPRPYFTAYGTAKAALVRFSETLAHEASELRIRVNAIAPGAMATEMAEAVLRARPERAGTEEFSRAQRQTTASAAVPENAAELVAFLASNAAERVTGRLISAVWDPWRTLSNHVAELDGSDIYTLRRIVPLDRGRNWE